jgi:uncharacterized membrane protein
VAAVDPHDWSGTTSTGVDPRLSALLCYTAWWVSGLIFLIIEQQHRTVRFHAAQSLIVFGGLSVFIAVLSVMSLGMLIISGGAFQLARVVVYLVWIAAVGLWLFLMYRTYQGQTWRVPGASTLAAKIAAR